MTWKNCDEEQPKKEGEYLCCIAQIGGFTKVVAAYRGNGFWTDPHYNRELEDLSHWMPLPASPPRESTEKQGGLALFAALRA